MSVVALHNIQATLRQPSKAVLEIEPLPRATRDLMVMAILEEAGVKPNEAMTRGFYRSVLCLCLLAAGQTREQCAVLLNIQQDTVKKHIQRVQERLNGKGRLHTYRLAKQEGYIFEHSKTSE